MALGSMVVLAPNRLGDSLTNRGVESFMSNQGVESLTANRGYGVPTAMKTNAEAAVQQEQTANPVLVPLRRAKARQFGMKIEEIGF